MPETRSTRFWVGASTTGALGSPARGIRPLDVANDGSWHLGEPVDVGPNPMYLAISPASGLMGIVHEQSEGLVSTWTVEGDALRAFGEPQPTDAADPCHLAFDEAGRWLFAANYSGGRLTAHAATPDAGTPVRATTFAGSGPDTGRQESSHPHQAVLDGARNRVLVPDLGADRIRSVGLAGLPDRLEHDGASDVPIHAGAGPRHLVIAGDLGVVANELDRTASLIDLALGREVGAFAVDAAVEPRGLGLSAIRLTRWGTVLIGDRDADALVALRFDEASRTLEHIRAVSTGGRHPRDLHLTHDERFALVADQASDSIAIVALDEGVPTRVVDTIATPAPGCLARMP
ncbi:beta-propeller fold lactonase family protein [Agromyces sp. CFH 90414]|uniref:Beta-propeller fold lactonase family protein n=1 Tax=Agromyces agglutinans TaxID=2662258 RepID=A0A6I2FJY3_9MICO|nr:beta-propeller fold lactonase family protein [Agromyces agglutinans]MRG60998.1 beta-propeller fold lactonase family protein [Agromyces agglutinans]